LSRCPGAGVGERAGAPADHAGRRASIRRRAAQDDAALSTIEIDVERVDAEVDRLRRRPVTSKLRHAHEGREPRAQDRLTSREAREQEPLVAAQEVDALIRRRGLEEAPVDRGGHVEAHAVDRAPIEPAEQPVARGPALRDRREARDARRVRGVEQARRRRARGVVVTTRPAERLFVRDGHARGALHRRGPVIDDGDRLVEHHAVAGERHAEEARARDDRVPGDDDVRLRPVGREVARGDEAPPHVVADVSIGEVELRACDWPHRPVGHPREVQLRDGREDDAASISPEDRSPGGRLDGAHSNRPRRQRGSAGLHLRKIPHRDRPSNDSPPLEQPPPPHEHGCPDTLRLSGISASRLATAVRSLHMPRQARSGISLRPRQRARRLMPSNAAVL
jgi:hypothetical protein